jgi:UDP-N-acetyl-D-mannosaminuronate dehydrogenase
LEFKRPLVIGMGEIGKPLYEIVKGIYPDAQWLDIETKEIDGKIDVIHICFPYSESFVSDVIKYINCFQPNLTIIESTVLPFTTSKIYAEVGGNVCHSPVRGRCATGFKWGLFTFTKFIGGATPGAAILAEKYYKSLDIKTRICNSPLETEFMKIINTSYYGLCIAWFQEIERICKKFDLDVSNVKDFIKSTGTDSGGKVPRPVYYGGFIEGHCVIPNALLLQQAFHSKFIEVILESNEKKKDELNLENEGNRKQIEKLRQGLK